MPKRCWSFFMALIEEAKDLRKVAKDFTQSAKDLVKVAKEFKELAKDSNELAKHPFNSRKTRFIYLN